MRAQINNCPTAKTRWLTPTEDLYVAVPDFQRLMLPVLKLAGDGQVHTLADAIDYVVKEFRLSDIDVAEQIPSGQPRLNNRLGWTTTYLRKALVLEAAGPGRYQITDRGRQLLASNPTSIDVDLLKADSRKWSSFGRSKRLRLRTTKGRHRSSTASGSSERGLGPHQTQDRERIARGGCAHRRSEVLRIRDRERGRGTGEWLDTPGEIQRASAEYGPPSACDLRKSTFRVAVVGPVSDDVRSALGAEVDNDEEFKAIPGAVLLSFPANRAAVALELLKDGLNTFVDLAMARVEGVSALRITLPKPSLMSLTVGAICPSPLLRPSRLMSNTMS